MDECKIRAPGSLEWEGQQPMTEREKQHLLRCAIAFVEIEELENVGGESRASLAHKLQVMLAAAPDGEPKKEFDATALVDVASLAQTYFMSAARSPGVSDSYVAMVKDLSDKLSLALNSYYEHKKS